MSGIFYKRLATIIALVLVWQLFCKTAMYPTYLLPTPEQVEQTLLQGIIDGQLVIALLSSLKRMVIGYSMAVVLGLALGVALIKWKYLDQTIGFFILAVQTIPSVAWLPLALIWFGLNERAIIFVVIIGSLWTMVMSVKTAIKGVNPDYIRLAKTLGYNKWALFWKIVIPAALPELIVGLRLAWAFAWRSLLAGELLGGESGLGQTLMIGRNLGDMSLVIAVMIIIATLGILIDLFLFQRLENQIFAKRGYSSKR
ncbi:MAG: ABC transporter permease [Negativicutes bacterium]